MKKFLPLLTIFFIIFSLAHAINFELVYYNGTVAKSLLYDYDINTSNGSFSYKDNSIRNPNIYAKICDINSSYLNSYVDLLYASESGNLTLSILSLLPQIYSIDNTTNCSSVDIDISSFRALYPAIPFAALYEKVNNSFQLVWIKKLENFSLNGSYLLGVDIDDVQGKTFLKIVNITDDRNVSITKSAKFVIFSIVSNNRSVAEKISKPFTRVEFNYMFQGNETVFVNGLQSLKVKVIDPCENVTKEGYYYILSESAWNTNKSCLVVENVTNIVIDFGNKTIDGDGNYSINFCGVVLKNVENVTLRDVRVHEFGKGICIFDSKNVKISGTSVQNNIDGVYSERSTVQVSRVVLSNKDSEIRLTDKSIIYANKVHFLTANISLEGQDIILKNVLNPPEDPVGLRNISQWINITKNGNSWVNNLKFHFIFPNPDGIIPEVIYKINGSIINGTWTDIEWTPISPTFVDLANKYIIAQLNITNFSIFAPYGRKINITEPVPEPQPEPTPSQIIGQEELVVPPRIDLKLLNESVTVQQGETFEVPFEIINNGQSSVADVKIIAEVRYGWYSTIKTVPLLSPNRPVQDSLFISVYENEIPGKYFIAVKAIIEGNITADTEILEVNVIPRVRVALLDIIELPPYLSLEELSKEYLSVLVENTGDYDLSNIRLKIENAEECIERVSGTYSLKVGERKALSYEMQTREYPAKCNSVFVFLSDRGPVALYPVIIEIRPKEIERVQPVYLLLILLIINTIALIWRIRKRRTSWW